VIQDLDELATAEEVLKAIATATERSMGEARVVSTLMARRGQKWMVVLLLVGTANKIQGIGKLRVRYVSCRLRQWEDRGKGRGSRCLVVGLARASCSGPDRNDCCRA